MSLGPWVVTEHMGYDTCRPYYRVKNAGTGAYLMDKRNRGSVLNFDGRKSAERRAKALNSPTDSHSVGEQT